MNAVHAVDEAQKNDLLKLRLCQEWGFEVNYFWPNIINDGKCAVRQIPFSAEKAITSSVFLAGAVLESANFYLKRMGTAITD